jgi:D-sedoheptulose 7-phosphate isomerase
MINEYLNNMSHTILELESAKILKIIEVLREAREKKHWIYTFGNGGSGSTASHFAGDLSKACGFKAFCLNDSMPSLTAWANDADYRIVFERQLGNIMDKGDIIFAISGSGNSLNVIRALMFVKEKGIYSIGLTAFDGGQLRNVANLSIIVPISNMEIAEDIHLMICHIIKTALVVK